jgi:hypothetical protein
MAQSYIFEVGDLGILDLSLTSIDRQLDVYSYEKWVGTKLLVPF